MAPRPRRLADLRVVVLTGRFVLGPPVDRGERMSDEISEILVLLSLAALTVAPMAGIAVAWFRFDWGRHW